MSRYIVGIDLGTTNCAVAYVDLEGSGERDIRAFPIPQLVAQGEIDERATLPSFLLLPSADEVAADAMSLPWAKRPGFAVGEFARDRGADLPHRLVASAKSWLSYSAIDRRAALLPWRGAEAEEGHTDAEQVSPVEASTRTLGHLRAAWDHVHPDAPLAEQEILLTVPASFDAVARELTVLASQQAGLPNVVLLEEPQAAFYSWLARSGDKWRKALVPGDAVVVCDVGGGTTDFSTIAVADDGAGNLVLERVAVGDHILVGGDNMDLALAHMVGQRMGGKIGSWQQRALVYACRRAKEQLLGQGAPDKVPVTVLGRGSKLIGGTLRTDLRGEDVQRLLLDGFFPFVDADAKPQKRRTVGLKELGLPFAQDAAITRHLADFLARHGRRPTAILFNGGVMKGDALRARIAEVVGLWFGQASMPALTGTDLDLAVAHGAAYYGLVRHGRGIRIRGGVGRSYYIGIETAMPAIPGFAPPLKAMCVVPSGLEEGNAVELPGEELGLIVGETAEFRFFASTTRPQDKPGALLDPEKAELIELDPVEATLPAEGDSEGRAVPVTLEARVTDVGTLELWCVARDGHGRWKLEYSVRERG
jgi:molecular chaperone DnaK (HSP70)